MALIYDMPMTMFVGDSDELLETGDTYATFASHKGAPVYVFDDTIEKAIVTGWHEMGAFTTSLTAKLMVYTATATSGTLDFEVFVAVAVPGTTNVDLETDETLWNAANAGSVTVAASAGRPYEISIALTNDGSIASGNRFRIGIRRDADDGTNDTATGDAYLAQVSLHDAS